MVFLLGLDFLPSPKETHLRLDLTGSDMGETGSDPCLMGEIERESVVPCGVVGAELEEARGVFHEPGETRLA